MGLFMFLNLGIKMPEIRLVIRCICAPLLHVSVCLHFGNNLSFYHLHIFIVFVFVQKSVKKNGVNVPYKILSNFIFLFFSSFFLPILIVDTPKKLFYLLQYESESNNRIPDHFREYSMSTKHLFSVRLYPHQSVTCSIR